MDMLKFIKYKLNTQYKYIKYKLHQHCYSHFMILWLGDGKGAILTESEYENKMY
jgi:hypothetical protein